MPNYKINRGTLVIDDAFEMPDTKDLVVGNFGKPTNGGGNYVNYTLNMTLNGEKFNRIQFYNCDTAVIETEVSGGKKAYSIMVLNSKIIEFCELIDTKLKESILEHKLLKKDEMKYKPIVAPPSKDGQSGAVFLPVKPTNEKLMVNMIYHKETNLPLLSEKPLTERIFSRYVDDYMDEVNAGKKVFDYVTAMYGEGFKKKKAVRKLEDIKNPLLKFEILTVNNFVERLKGFKFYVLSFNFGKFMHKNNEGVKECQIGKYFGSGIIEEKVGGIDSELEFLQNEFNKINTEEESEDVIDDDCIDNVN